MRQIHNIEQGNSEWHSFRAKHFGASEASAMLGLSPYKTRSELLHEKFTGLARDVDSFTQKIFDKGHEVEKLALKIVEKLIGQELYPVTASLGKLSASCDGLSMDETIAWENKQFNANHYEQVMADELPEIHWPQCQQVLLVTGAEKLYFTISDGTEERTKGIWVYPDTKKQQLIADSWKQFESDLANYVPPLKVKKVQTEVISALPVPSIVAKGELVASNMGEITPYFDNYLSNIKTELATDEDFANAEANGKNCRDMAKKLDNISQAIISQMADVNEVISTLGQYSQKLNQMGLRLEKAVKDQKENLKTQAIMKARIEYADFVTVLNKGIDIPLSLRLTCPDFAGAIKGVKTLESMQSRINDALANGKLEATTLANDVKSKIAYINEAIKGYEHLFRIDAIVFSDIDYIKLHIQSVKDAEDVRRAKHEAAIKEQAEADARAKLEREAQEKARAELEAKIQAEAEAKSAQQASIPDGDAIKNDTINEADFKAVFEAPAVQPITAAKRPTANAIINLVATTYQVDASVAHRWLAQSFGELKAA